MASAEAQPKRSNFFYSGEVLPQILSSWIYNSIQSTGAMLRTIPEYIIGN